MKQIKELFYILIVSFIISYSIRPIHIRLIRTGLRSKSSSFIIIGMIFLFLISCITFLIPSIINESSNYSDAISGLQKFIEDIYKKLQPFGKNKILFTVINNISNKIEANSISFMEGIFSFAVNIGSNLISIAVIPIISYYFLADGSYIYKRIINILPLNWRQIAQKTANDIDKVMGKYIASQFLLSLIIGMLTFIVLIVYKIQFPVILSMLNAFLNIIPYFGPLFGAVPCILIALLKSPSAALWVGIWIYLIQQLEGNILQPKITGESINMHPVAVILLLLIGEKSGGILGMILAIPIGVIIKIVYEDINYYIF